MARRDLADQQYAVVLGKVSQHRWPTESRLDRQGARQTIVQNQINTDFSELPGQIILYPLPNKLN